MPDHDISKADRRLLMLVQRNNRMTGDQLAAAAGLSPTACQRRLKRLRAAGVIEADVSIVSPAAVGRNLTMIVMINLERERADIVDDIKRLARDTPEITTCYYTTGETDFVLVVTSRDMNDFEAFSRRVLYENPNIRGFKTLVAIDRVKVGFEVPVGSTLID